MECYKYVTDILDDLTEISVCASQTPSVPLMPGPPKPPQETNDPKPLTPEQAPLHVSCDFFAVFLFYFIRLNPWKFICIL